MDTMISGIRISKSRICVVYVNIPQIMSSKTNKTATDKNKGVIIRNINRSKYDK